MRFSTTQHRFYCGVDLHARTLSLGLLDQAGNTLLAGYAYPKGLRETRDLLRRRMYLVRKQAERITHVVNTN
jgi:hypothetical protein